VPKKAAQQPSLGKACHAEGLAIAAGRELQQQAGNFHQMFVGEQKMTCVDFIKVLSSISSIVPEALTEEEAREIFCRASGTATTDLESKDPAPALTFDEFRSCLDQVGRECGKKVSVMLHETQRPLSETRKHLLQPSDPQTQDT